MDYEKEVKRRRTFAIISHPDAGKTTITEKILYLGGVIREAGAVHGKAGTKKATSDWMTLEQERGVSITSSVMQFDYHGLRVNLLDTPGHKDFSEDTYRTLVAADSAAMLLDTAKGVELQTRKLYEVCRLKRLPIFTFVNKMDREGKDPLALIDDVESTLGIKCYPVTWPIGIGDRFKGLYHRLRKELFLYTKGTEIPEIVKVDSWSDPKIQDRVGEEFFNTLQEEMELLEVAIGDWDQDEFLKGDVSPMTFGSAKQNWGVDLFLDLFAEYSPEPRSRLTTTGTEINPLDKQFSGFVFKIQANMDRKHRDRVAFLRVCSGRFERGMKVHHTRLDRELRLAYANQFLAQERETVDEAYPGDIVGIIDTGYFQVGDTITGGKDFQFEPIPRFSPELFGKLFIKDPLKRKTLQKGVQQLAEEGMIQLLYDPLYGKQDPILGVVGEMQFEVLLFRLNDEYQLDARLDRLPYSVARWPVNVEDGKNMKSIQGGGKQVVDDQDRLVVLLEKEWDLNWLKKENPTVDFKISGA